MKDKSWEDVAIGVDTRELTTCFPFPYALMLWGGTEEGKRPPTKRCFIHEFIVDEYAVSVRVALGKRWAKKARKIPASHIVHTWRHAPTEAEVRRVKAKMKPYVSPLREGAA